MSPVHVITLIGPAFTIALLGAIESLLSAVVADGMSGTRFDRVPFMDLTGIHTLSQTIQELRKKAVSVVLCEANELVRDKLLRAGLLEASADMSCNRSLARMLWRALPVPPERLAGAHRLRT